MTSTRSHRVARFGLWLALIGVVALGLRTSYVVLAKSDDDACGEELCGDAFYYSVQAEVLGGGDGFTQPFTRESTADHPPLTALVATPAVWLPGDPILPQRLTMALVGTGAVIVIGRLGRAVAGDRVGLIAAGVAAVYPNLWINDGVVMSESLTALLTATCLLLTYRLLRSPTAAAAAGLGAAVGLAILTRAELALYLPLVVVPVLVASVDLGLVRKLGGLVVVGAATIAVLAPWTLYNVSRFEEPVVVSTNDGLTLIGANCEGAYRGPGTGLWIGQCAEEVPAEGDQSQVSATYRRAGFDFMGDNIGRLPVVVATRVGRVWGLYAPGQMASYSQGEGRERWASLLGTVVYSGVVVVAAAGVVVLRRRRTPVWPLVGTGVLVTITAATLYGLTRFRVPAEVAIIVLAAVAVDAAFRRHPPSRQTDPAEPESRQTGGVSATS